MVRLYLCTPIQTVEKPAVRGDVNLRRIRSVMNVIIRVTAEPHQHLTSSSSFRRLVKFSCLYCCFSLSSTRV